MTREKDPQRVLLGRIGAYTLHSMYDSRKLLEPARRGFASKFEREVDPDMVLDPEERARRAEMARKAYFTRLALKSAQARRKRSERRRAAMQRTRTQTETRQQEDLSHGNDDHQS